MLSILPEKSLIPLQAAFLNRHPNGHGSALIIFDAPPFRHLHEMSVSPVSRVRLATFAVLPVKVSRTHFPVDCLLAWHRGRSYTNKARHIRKIAKPANSRFRYSLLKDLPFRFVLRSVIGRVSDQIGSLNHRHQVCPCTSPAQQRCKVLWHHYTNT